MRPAALAWLSVLFVAAHATAEQQPYRAVVSDPEVKLRAGPSDRFHETNTLARGAVVHVERDLGDGWLAVTAPSGSVSWIAATFVEDLMPDRPSPKNGYVHTEGEVTLAAGKVGEPQPLDIRREKVPQGTIVVILGPKVDFGGKKWYPIAPPAGDVRYVPKTAVQFDKPVNNAFTVRMNDHTGAVPAGAMVPVPPGASGPVASIPGPGSTGSGAPAPGVTAAKPAVNHPLWLQAEAAEREGRLDEADKLYFELARQMNGTGGDHDIANLCYTRIHTLREKKRAGSAPTAPTGVLQPPSKDDRGVRPGAPQALPPAAPPAGGSGASDQAKWSGPGTLKRTAVTPEPGRRAYILEDAPGAVRAYVVPAQGVDLEKHVGKRVDVFGVSGSRNGLSKPVITATQVEVP